MSRMLTLLAALGLTVLATTAPVPAAEGVKKPAADKPAADKPASDKPAADGNVLQKTDDVKSWRLEQHETAKGTIAAEDGAIAFDVTKEDGNDWHVQAFQTPVTLKKDVEYVVTFKAKAAAERAVKVQAGIDEEDWHNVGLDEEVTLGKQWKDYEYKFTADNVSATKNRVGFVLGMAKGKVWVKDLVVKPAKK